MKTSFTLNVFRIVISLAFILLCNVSFSQTPVKSNGSWNCSQGKMQHKAILENKSLNSPKHSYDVLKYTMNLDLYNCYFSPYPNSFHGSEIIKFEVDTALNNINLNAVDSTLAIDSVRMSGVSFTHANDLLNITLDRTYNAGEITEVKIYYHHLNIFDDAFYTGAGFAYTDAEPDRARCWFPCWDKPSDKALWDITAKVPNTVLLGSNGRLVDSVQVADTIYYHWASRDPLATYLMVLTSKVGYKLDVLYWPLPSNPTIKIPIRYYYNDGEDPSGSENVILDMMTFYSTSFCEHPFEKNGFCSLDGQFLWGGMENQTLTSFCAGCWDESLTAHEFAHQWFGDMITCGTWADVFLNEGFATYIEALWQGHAHGAAAYKSDIDNYANYYLTNNAGWAIYNPSWAVTTPNMWDLFDYSITYCKGAGVLHMFRYSVGDSLFFASLRAYANDTVNFKLKNSTITDFRTKMNTTCGENLDWFFDEWLNQANHPVYANTYSFYNNGNGTWTANFMASQVQTNAGFYTMPVELMINFNNGTDTLVKVFNNQNNQLFQFVFNKQPIALTFDPNNNIVLKEGTTTVGVNEYADDASGIALFQNVPNPASDITKISFELTSESPVKICVLDVVGKIVSVELNKKMSAGIHQIEFNTAGLSKGIYFYSLESGGKRLMKKMVIM